MTDTSRDTRTLADALAGLRFADDPTVRVLEIEATAGEYWDGPSGRVGQIPGSR